MFINAINLPTIYKAEYMLYRGEKCLLTATMKQWYQIVSCMSINTYAYQIQ